MNSKIWILVLLLANGASAALIMGTSEAPQIAGEPWPAIEPAIRLLDEMERLPVPTLPPPTIQPAIVALEPPASAKACMAWGPFNDKQAVAALLAEIQGAGGSSDLIQAHLQGEPDYLVLIGPEGSSEVVRRVHKELDSLSIESHMISTGRFANSLSVGVFTQRTGALAQQQRVAELGYQVGIQELDRSQSVYHLLAKVSPDFTGSQEPSADCEDIAPEHQFL